MTIAMFMGGQMVSSIEMVSDLQGDLQVAEHFCREVCPHRDFCEVEGCDSMEGYYV